MRCFAVISAINRENKERYSLIIVCITFAQYCIQIVESNQGFAPLTTVYPVQGRNTSSTITIGHIDECHYVSTTALQSNASISMCNELTNDTQSSRNNHFIISIFVNSKSVLASTEEGGGV